MKTGIELIAQERSEQLEKHSYSIEYDVKENNWCQLSEAASLLCTTPRHTRDNEDITEFNIVPFKWDEEQFSKMMNKEYKERLIIAGALIVAEIDRLNSSNQ